MAVECGIGGWRYEDGGVGEQNRSGGRSEISLNKSGTVERTVEWRK